MLESKIKSISGAGYPDFLSDMFVKRRHRYFWNQVVGIHDAHDVRGWRQPTYRRKHRWAGERPCVSFRMMNAHNQSNCSAQAMPGYIDLCSGFRCRIPRFLQARRYGVPNIIKAAVHPPLLMSNRLRNRAKILQPLMLGVCAPDGNYGNVVSARDDAPVAIFGDHNLRQSRRRLSIDHRLVHGYIARVNPTSREFELLIPRELIRRRVERKKDIRRESRIERHFETISRVATL